MVVDDSAVIRGIFRRTLEVDPEIEVVASANNGQVAVDTLAKTPVDIVLLDIEMPVMDGMTALPKLLELNPDVQVIMASTLTQKNADISFKAMAAGATDYIPKPTAKHEIHSSEGFKRELLDKVKALAHAKRGGGRAPRAAATATPGSAPAASVRPKPPTAGITLRPASLIKPEILFIGSSTGGPQALMAVLGELGSAFDLPIVITQHMPKTFTGILAQHIGKATQRPTAEAVDGETIEKGRIYVAPGEKHLLVESGQGRPTLRLDDGPPENYCKPAVDPMLRSAAPIYRQKLLTLILTGMGHDGREGGRNVVDAGGTVIAQDEASSVVWGMPGAVANAGLCSAVLPLQQIARHINQFVGR
jgi:two-component system chemotaxis response regulator CheB